MKQLDSVQKLLNSVALLCERRLHRQADIAPRFNLFRILGVEEKEVSTHSAFLAHLLNPSEGHAQGDLFLRQFLLEIGHEQLASFDGWIISKEVPIVGGRLDIVLQSAKASAIIVVENKLAPKTMQTNSPLIADGLMRRTAKDSSRLGYYFISHPQATSPKMPRATSTSRFPIRAISPDGFLRGP